MKPSFRALSLLLLLAACSFAAMAQTSKGILAGVIRDNTGAVIPSASITITEQATGAARTSHSDAQGTFRVDAMNPGLYTIRVEMNGFVTKVVQDLNVQPSIVTDYDPVMIPGGVSESVLVEANSNTINTENGQLAGTISSAELSSVPIFTLNPIELATTIPGVQVVDSNLGLGGIGGNFEQIEVNGTRPRANNFMMDGQDINDTGIGGQSFNPQIPDAFETVTAITNSASAEYGRAGGAIVNLVTKSGSSKFHGDAWELYSGSGLDSLDGITRKGKPYPNNPKARYDEHQPGFTAGGPIWKNKLFAFGGLVVERYFGNSQPGAFEYPDAAGYAQLQAIGGPQVTLLDSYLYNGSYLTSYVNVGEANAYAITSRPGCPSGCTITTALFERPAVAQQAPETQWIYRIDFTPRQQDQFSWRYLHDRANFVPDLGVNFSGLPGFDGEVGGPTELGQGAWTHIFTAKLLNEFRASETRLDILFQGTPQSQANPLYTAPNITFNGQGFGGAATPLGFAQTILPQGTIQDLYQYQDTVSWTHGRQTWRIGADVGRDIEIDLVAQNANGGLLYTSGGGASALDNFLDNYLGSSGQASKTFGPTRVDPHSWRTATFAQDDVKLTPELTLNLGLRYDYLTNPENSLPYPAVDINNPYQPITTVVPVINDKNNIAPRFGFAWNPHGSVFADGKTVFRGGFGGFYDTDFTNIVTNGAQAAPNAPTGTLTCTGSTCPRGLGNSTGLLNTISPTLTAMSTVQTVSNHMVNPLTWQWNFGIERQLPGQFRIALNYVGNRGEKLFANQQLNYEVNGVRINPSRGIINIRSNRADSEYNSAQVEVSRQYSHGLFVRAVYVYGKDLDDASEVFGTFASPTSYSANLAPNGLHQDWGPSVWDHRQYASFIYSWTPGGFHSSRKGVNTALSVFTRHFTISGTTELQSGPYTTFNFNGLDMNDDGSSANDRPLVANASQPIDTAAFDGYYFGPPYTPGVYYDAATGNPVPPTQEHWLVPHGAQYMPFEIGRNSFENPGTQYWNLSLEKDVPSSWFHLDRGMLVLRVEAQNFTNHDNLGPLDINLLDIGTPAYMNRSNATEPMNRHLLLWAKFRF
ncbi:MAG TPA: carboxypeptidase regulatory-like domain-containing protein [Acidobacteriaceae bacterium]|nr:carboxypeptidase regulatory-like domain-containing protein [Acidobacteriaceae bacterium]